MFGDQLRTAIEAAPRQELARLGEAMWKAWGRGLINDANAEELSALIEARKSCQTALNGRGPGSSAQPGRSSVFPPKRPQRSPDRVASRYRRRHHARARWMPDVLADKFSDGEVAALAVVAQEHQSGGLCDLAIGRIAALAGVSETTVRNALREARHLGLLSVEERPQQGRPHLTNVIRLVSREWITWINRRPASWAKGGGCRGLKATQGKENNPLNPPRNPAHGTDPKGCRKEAQVTGPPIRA